MFEKKGVIVTNKDISFDEAEEFAIEIGAEEVEEEEDVLIFSCDPFQFSEIHNKLKEKFEVKDSQIRYIPSTYTEFTSKRDKGLFILFLKKLEEHQEVVAFHHNADI